MRDDDHDPDSEFGDMADDPLDAETLAGDLRDAMLSRIQLLQKDDAPGARQRS